MGKDHDDEGFDLHPDPNATPLIPYFQEQWHIYYCEHHGQFTLYLNLPRQMTMVSNWREHGVHTRGSANKRDYPLLDYCAIELQVPTVISYFFFLIWQSMCRQFAGLPRGPAPLRVGRQVDIGR